MSVHVFVGPTLDARSVLEIRPDARLHQPVAHGDLLRLPAAAGDTVVLIDGYFHQVGAVRHKEILDLLSRGVRVVGCSSMGALRAAELHPFGMIGHGTVFEMYRKGVIDSDGEVVVAHGEEPDYRNFSLALVNVRCAAETAQAWGVLSPAEAEAVVRCAASVHYTGRSWRSMRAAAEGDPLATAALTALERFVTRHPGHGNVKANDAVSTLRQLESPDGRAPTCADDDWTTSPGWRTRYLYDWQAAFRGREVDGVHVADGAVARYRQIHDPDFPAWWRRHVLAQISGLPPRSDPHALEAEALAVAADHGLAPGRLPASQQAAWLTPDEIAARSPRAALLDILVRSYQRPGCGNLLEVAAALSVAADPDGEAAAAAAVAAASGSAEPERAELLAYLATVWHRPDVDGLRAAAMDRGFRSADEAAEALLPFSRGRAADTCTRATETGRK